MPQAPVFIRLPPGRLISSNSTSPSCFGLPTLNSMPGEAMAVLLHHRHALLEIDRHAAQIVGVDLDAGALHVQQHRDQAALDLLVQRQRLVGAQPRPQRLPQPQRDVGVLGGVGGGALDRHLREAGCGCGRCR